MNIHITLNNGLSAQDQESFISFLKAHNYISSIQVDNTEEKSTKPITPTTQSPETKEDTNFLREEWLRDITTQETLANILSSISPQIRINRSLGQGNLKKAFAQHSLQGECYGYLARIKPLEDNQGFKVRVIKLNPKFNLDKFVSWCGAFGLTSETAYHSEKGFFYTDLSKIAYDVVKETTQYLDFQITKAKKTNTRKPILNSQSPKGRLTIGNNQGNNNNGIAITNPKELPDLIKTGQGEVTSRIQGRLRNNCRSSGMR